MLGQLHRVSILVLSYFLLGVIGLFASNLSLAEDTFDEDKVPPGMVIVEPGYVNINREAGSYELVSYDERRGRWGFLVGAQYSSYEPIFYSPNFALPDYAFADVYSSPEIPAIELQFVMKRNLSVFSFGGELIGSVYQNTSDEPDAGNSKLNLYPIRLGVLFALDAYSDSPYVVPYVSGGAYMVFYRETLEETSFNGNTQPAPYATAGLAFLLDWLDSDSARAGFEQSGLERTTLNVEARKLFPSTAANDPDFSNEVSWSAGLRLEF